MTEPHERPRLLVLVLGNRSGSRSRRVLDGLPAELVARCETEVLWVDEGIEDRAARDGEAPHPALKTTVLRDDFDHGYGGHRKVGFTDAIRRGFDLVAVLEGDGGSAAAELLGLLEPLLAGEADAVFGTRLRRLRTGRRRAMPATRRLGAALLTACQNAVLGTGLSDLHCRYRAYSVAALERIPFALNSNDRTFDTQVVLQLVNAGMRLVEVPVAAGHDREIGIGGGLRHATTALLWTFRNVAHRAGVLYQRALDTELGENTHYALKLGYPSSHTYAIAAVPAGASVLDLGSGPGDLASELEKKGCRVTLLDRLPPSAEGGERNYLVQDLDEPLEFRVDGYDIILLLDILEHLSRPERFLERLRQLFDHRPMRVILTTPNVAFVVQRAMLALGQFNYGKKGILDLTHTRLFTFRSLRRLLREYGFRVHEVKGVPAPFPLVFGDGFVGRAMIAVNRALIRVSKSLFSYQIYVEMTTTPGVEYVLDRVRRDSPDGRPASDQG